MAVCIHICDEIYFQKLKLKQYKANIPCHRSSSLIKKIHYYYIHE